MTPDTPITLRADALAKMVSQYVQVGYSMAVKMYEPVADNIRKSEVEKWLKNTDGDLKLFRKLVRAEEIRPHQIGYGKNSPIYFFKSEILAAFARHKVREVQLANTKF